MNTYSTQFIVVDPESGHPVPYTFKVKTPSQVVVEVADLVGAALMLAKKPRKPEDIADTLKTMFPGKHLLTARIFGVTVTHKREGTA